MAARKANPSDFGLERGIDPATTEMMDEIKAEMYWLEAELCQ